jgi:hypothetical protein
MEVVSTGFSYFGQLHFIDNQYKKYSFEKKQFLSTNIPISNLIFVKPSTCLKFGVYEKNYLYFKSKSLRRI